MPPPPVDSNVTRDTQARMTNDSVVVDDTLAATLAPSLTVGQAIDYIRRHGRRAPAERTMQRYCHTWSQSGAATKIRTSFGDEWLISPHVLDAILDRFQRLDDPSLHFDISGATDIGADDGADAANTPATTTATPDGTQSANAKPATSGDDGVSAVPPVRVSDDTTDTPAEMAEVAPAGETRTLVQVLIENSKLIGKLEGLERLNAEMKDDQTFLRDEVRDARTMRRDVTMISQEMLRTMKLSIMQRGQLSGLAQPSDAQIISDQLAGPKP